MTLKDQFLKASVIEGVVDNSEVIAATNAMIADEFAIGFAEFQSRFLTKPVEGRFYCYYNSQWITTKQLLEIYKQEKGL